jgi:hypothetical protein
MLFRVVILTNDRQLLHIEAVLLEFADRALSLLVCCKDRDHGVLAGNHRFLQLPFEKALRGATTRSTMLFISHQRLCAVGLLRNVLDQDVNHSKASRASQTSWFKEMLRKIGKMN